MKDINRCIQKYWDKRSGDFGAVRRKELASSDAAAWQSYIQRFLPAGQPLDILDIGTGPGFLAILMAKLGHRVTAMDSSTGMISEGRINAREYGVAVDFLIGDAQTLPFAGETFDVVLSRNLTWNLPDAVAAYREWYRVLRLGGILINFDADYGKVRFDAVAEDEKNIHHHVERTLIQECETLKDTLAISRECRPEWDLHWLDKIGFRECLCERDIRPSVHTSPDMLYDSEPIFSISARKR